MSHLHTLRGRLTALAVLVALLAIAGLTVAFNVALDRSLDSDAKGRLRSRADAARTTVSVERGRLRVNESPGDAAVDQDVWIYEGRHALERPLVGGAVQRAADALAGQGGQFRDVRGRDFRLYADPIRVGGAQLGTVITGTSLAAYDRTTDLALLGSIVLGAVLLVAMGALSWLVVGRALAPVGEMTRTAADWSAHDPDRRFGSHQRPDELGELARTFDALLDRVATSLRHEQRLSAELSHELRTPLARIVAEIELLQRRERSAEDRSDAYAVVARSAEQMSGILETLMAAARAEAQLDVGRSDVGGILDRVAEGWAPALAEREVELEVRHPAAPMMAGVDAEVVERIVAPLIDNALRYARSHILLSSVARDGAIVLSVADDGPGVGAEAREHVFEPGRVAGVNGPDGAGLGLPLARRLALAVGGDVTLIAPGADAGAEFQVRLPA